MMINRSDKNVFSNVFITAILSDSMLNVKVNCNNITLESEYIFEVHF